MIRQSRGKIAAAVHETAEGLHAAGVMDKQTLRTFDAACPTQVRPLAADDIRTFREREGASQAVFARYLNVTTGLVSQWERRGASARRVAGAAGVDRQKWTACGGLNEH